MTALTRLISIAVACLALAFTAACSDSEPQAPAPSTPPTSVAPTPTPTGPTEPTLPEAATQPGKAGAEAFVRHYWDMVNYAQQTGDVSGLKRLSAPECEPCTSGWKRLQSIYSSGGNIEGGEHKVVALTARLAVGGQQVQAWTTDARVSYGRQVITQPGTKPISNDPGQMELRLYNRFHQGAWDMTGIES